MSRVAQGPLDGTEERREQMHAGLREEREGRGQEPREDGEIGPVVPLPERLEEARGLARAERDGQAVLGAQQRGGFGEGAGSHRATILTRRAGLRRTPVIGAHLVNQPRSPARLLEAEERQERSDRRR